MPDHSSSSCLNCCMTPVDKLHLLLFPPQLWFLFLFSLLVSQHYVTSSLLLLFLLMSSNFRLPHVSQFTFSRLCSLLLMLSLFSWLIIMIVLVKDAKKWRGRGWERKEETRLPDDEDPRRSLPLILLLLFMSCHVSPLASFFLLTKDDRERKRWRWWPKEKEKKGAVERKTNDQSVLQLICDPSGYSNLSLSLTVLFLLNLGIGWKNSDWEHQHHHPPSPHHSEKTWIN